MKGRHLTYDPVELAWIEARKEWPRRELHAAFCAFWRRDDVSFDNLKALCTRNGWKTGRTGCFAAGHPTHNKGKPMPPEVRAKCLPTAFKKGNVPHTYRGPGSEFLCPKDGYIYLIIADDRATTQTKTRRVLKHKYLWEQANGPLPKGHALKCLDGDRRNTDPANWALIARAMLPRLAGVKVGINYDSAPVELRPSIMAIARLEHAARTGGRE